MVYIAKSGVKHRSSYTFYSLADLIHLYLKTLAYKRTHRNYLSQIETNKQKMAKNEYENSIRIWLQVFVGKEIEKAHISSLFNFPPNIFLHNEEKS